MQRLLDQAAILLLCLVGAYFTTGLGTEIVAAMLTAVCAAMLATYFSIDGRKTGGRESVWISSWICLALSLIHIYCREMGGGSVNPVTGAFNFAVREGYRIRNGKICEPLRGASLIGTGSEILQNIDMVGKNLEMGQGMCGASSGSIPTNVCLLYTSRGSASAPSACAGSL